MKIEIKKGSTVEEVQGLFFDFMRDNEWLMCQGGTLRITFQSDIPKGNYRAGRMTKEEARLMLSSYLLLPQAPEVWQMYDYDFNFKSGIYRRNNKSLYITPSAAVALYRRLILKRTGDWWWSALSNMRRRFGKDFLAGM